MGVPRHLLVLPGAKEGLPVPWRRKLSAVFRHDPAADRSSPRYPVTVATGEDALRALIEAVRIIQNPRDQLPGQDVKAEHRKHVGVGTELISKQVLDPGSDEALQHRIDGIGRGAPDYDRMTPLIRSLSILSTRALQHESAYGGLAHDPADWPF
jgi:hypothetical protein